MESNCYEPSLSFREGGEKQSNIHIAYGHGEEQTGRIKQGEWGEGPSFSLKVGTWGYPHSNYMLCSQNPFSSIKQGHGSY